MISLAFILAGLQVLPKHRASCSVHAQTGRERDKTETPLPCVVAKAHGMVHVAAVQGTNWALCPRKPSPGAPAFPSYSHSMQLPVPAKPRVAATL